MSRSNFAKPVAILVPVLLCMAGCASPTQQAESVRKVDDLLTSIERVHVDVTVAKDKVHAALQQLTTLVSPNFTGDAAKTFADLTTAIDESDKQVLELRNDMRPMTSAAESVFQRWASDLEAFGNTRMRQRSQSRLDETRLRYQNLLTTSQSVLLSFETFNADLRDQALFLGSDLNASAIAAITPDVRVLHQQVREVDGRVDLCAAAARAYVESAALYGQVEAVTTDAQPAAPQPEKPKTTFTKRRTSTLKPKPLPSAPRTTETPPAPEPEVGPQPEPVEEPVPQPAPVDGPGAVWR